MERDRGLGDAARSLRISTHTLTWSVTIPEPIPAEKIKISTHTLTWSVTLESVLQ